MARFRLPSFKTVELAAHFYALRVRIRRSEPVAVFCPKLHSQFRHRICSAAVARYEPAEQIEFRRGDFLILDIRDNRSISPVVEGRARNCAG
jgi:hypothetical protein